MGNCKFVFASFFYKDIISKMLQKTKTLVLDMKTGRKIGSMKTEHEHFFKSISENYTLFLYLEDYLLVWILTYVKAYKAF